MAESRKCSAVESAVLDLIKITSSEEQGHYFHSYAFPLIEAPEDAIPILRLTHSGALGVLIQELIHTFELDMTALRLSLDENKALFEERQWRAIHVALDAVSNDLGHVEEKSEEDLLQVVLNGLLLGGDQEEAYDRLLNAISNDRRYLEDYTQFQALACELKDLPIVNVFIHHFDTSAYDLASLLHEFKRLARFCKLLKDNSPTACHANLMALIKWGMTECCSGGVNEKSAFKVKMMNEIVALIHDDEALKEAVLSDDQIYGLLKTSLLEPIDVEEFRHSSVFTFLDEVSYFKNVHSVQKKLELMAININVIIALGNDCFNEDFLFGLDEFELQGVFQTVVDGLFSMLKRAELSEVLCSPLFHFYTEQILRQMPGRAHELFKTISDLESYVALITKIRKNHSAWIHDRNVDLYQPYFKARRDIFNFYKHVFDVIPNEKLFSTITSLYYMNPENISALACISCKKSSEGPEMNIFMQLWDRMPRKDRYAYYCLFRGVAKSSFNELHIFGDKRDDYMNDFDRDDRNKFNEVKVYANIEILLGRLISPTDVMFNEKVRKCIDRMNAFNLKNELDVDLSESKYLNNALIDKLIDCFSAYCNRLNSNNHARTIYDELLSHQASPNYRVLGEFIRNQLYDDLSGIFSKTNTTFVGLTMWAISEIDKLLVRSGSLPSILSRRPHGSAQFICRYFDVTSLESVVQMKIDALLAAEYAFPSAPSSSLLTAEVSVIPSAPMKEEEDEDEEEECKEPPIATPLTGPVSSSVFSPKEKENADRYKNDSEVCVGNDEENEVKEEVKLT